MSKASEASVPDTVEGLRRQNSAYRALCASLEATQAIQTAEGRKYHEAVSTLESERAANAILTDENARLTKERDMAVEALRVIAGHPYAGTAFANPTTAQVLDSHAMLAKIIERMKGAARATLTQLEASKGEG